jgi:uncharacterized protein
MLQVVVSKPVALIAMGLTPFIALALPEKLQLNVERPWHSSICGLVCVTLNLTAGIAGPLLDVFFVRSTMSRQAVVAMMIVLAFVGTSLSRQVLERISDAAFRQWTRRTLMTLGVVYLLGGLRLIG